jgi:glycosyltransferase involved in cell wall biosynthesis
VGAQVTKPVGIGVVERISVVVPVYQGERTLRPLVAELVPCREVQRTAGGLSWRIEEVVLVHDCSPDQSDVTIQALAEEFDWVRPLWLSRNFGQHAATLAGMAGALGDWVVTMDEDMQHPPEAIAPMLDEAIHASRQVVYASPVNAAPHGWGRNLSSRAAKRLAGWLAGAPGRMHFHSFRLINGEIARNLAAFCGTGVYLDVAMRWIATRIGEVPVMLRAEIGRPSGYSLRSLIRHFWRLVMTSGPRPLRAISLMGAAAIAVAIGIAGYAIAARFVWQVDAPGWSSLMTALAFFSGCILLALGVIAEFLASTMGIMMGRPPYLTVQGPPRRAPS